ncbi:ras-related protein Rab-1B-like [Sycon ciliatum]|uniref:ras-related protein Rab-1B-like n=1 Tax=Sycon ciliatum TaxID=27933 RepID=UPI0031F67A64
MAEYEQLVDERNPKTTVTTRQPVVNSTAAFSRRNISRTGSRSYHACHLSFKVVLAGEVDVGKTTLFTRLKAEAEQPGSASTGGGFSTSTASAAATRSSGHLLRTGRQGVNSKPRAAQFPLTESRLSLQLADGNLAEITLVDTAGEERFNQTLTGSHYRNADLVLFVFDVTNDLSLFALKHWVQQARAGAVEREGFLVGNKVDLRTQQNKSQCVAAGSASEFATVMGLALAEETSALNGQGVDCLLTQISAHFSSMAKTASFRSRTINQDDTAKPLFRCCNIL